MDKNYVDGLVSVIIPVYNVEKFIERTLDSVLAQTYQEVEIILVDDRSTDNSAQVISKYVSEYPQIKYHLQEKNMGAAVARNTALEMAQGRYVAFLDGDDEWYPQKLEEQLKLLKEKNIIVDRDVLNKITIDIMNISYAKGGSYSEKTIKCFATTYIEDSLYKKFL